MSNSPTLEAVAMVLVCWFDPPAGTEICVGPTLPESAQRFIDNSSMAAIAGADIIPEGTEGYAEREAERCFDADTARFAMYLMQDAVVAEHFDRADLMLSIMTADVTCAQTAWSGRVTDSDHATWLEAEYSSFTGWLRQMAEVEDVHWLVLHSALLTFYDMAPD